MNFNAPHEVLAHALSGPILSALAGVDTPLTRADVAHLIGNASEAGIRKALRRLVEQGIVTEEQIGSRYTYLANRDHLLWAAVEVLTHARAHLKSRVSQVIAGWAIAPLSIELFGSVAQGRSDEKSDIDVIIVRPDLDEEQIELWDQQVDALHELLVRWTGNGCDIIVFDPIELQAALKAGSPILNSSTVNLAGQHLGELLKAAS